MNRTEFCPECKRLTEYDPHFERIFCTCCDWRSEKIIKEYILCAAVHFDDGFKYEHMPTNITSGFVICGRRHHNCFATVAAINNVPLSKDVYKSVQGFMTNTDRFVNREEAAKIAYNAKQISEERDMLFSEHLY